jgi:hypothetical protein
MQVLIYGGRWNGQTKAVILLPPVIMRKDLLIINLDSKVASFRRTLVKGKSQCMQYKTSRGL